MVLLDRHPALSPVRADQQDRADQMLDFVFDGEEQDLDSWLADPYWEPGSPRCRASPGSRSTRRSRAGCCSSRMTTRAWRRRWSSRPGTARS